MQNNVPIRLCGIINPETRLPLTLVKTLPFDSEDPDIDYFTDFSQGDEIILLTHGSRGIFRVFSTIYGTVASIKKWTQLNPRRRDLRGLTIMVDSFHIGTYRRGRVLSVEHGSKEILMDGWKIEELED